MMLRGEEGWKAIEAQLNKHKTLGRQGECYCGKDLLSEAGRRQDSVLEDECRKTDRTSKEKKWTCWKELGMASASV